MYLLSPLLPTYAPCVQIDTLFPSPKTAEGIKGGVVLLRMRPPTAGANSTPLQLSVTYTDREGKQFRCGQSGQTFEEEVGQCAAADMPACLLHSRSAPLCSFSFPSLPACLPPSLCCSTKRTVAVPQQAAASDDGASGGSYFGSNGVEKAVLLARYTDILHDW